MFALNMVRSILVLRGTLCYTLYRPIVILWHIGHLARIGPRDLVTDDPQLLRRMSAVRSPYTRSDWYDGTSFNHKLDHVFSERNEARHNDLRAKLTSGVCLRSLAVA
jgi:hypothetical protein